MFIPEDNRLVMDKNYINFNMLQYQPDISGVPSKGTGIILLIKYNGRQIE